MWLLLQWLLVLSALCKCAALRQMHNLLTAVNRYEKIASRKSRNKLSEARGSCSQEARSQWESLHLTLLKDKQNGHAYLKCLHWVPGSREKYKISCVARECAQWRSNMPQFQTFVQRDWCVVANKCGGWFNGACEPIPRDELPKCQAPLALSVTPPSNTTGYAASIKACKADCKVCADSKTCVVCENSKYLIHSKYRNGCVNTCPKEYYNSGSGEEGRSCQACKRDCSECNDGSSCTKCMNSKYLHEGSCGDTCPNIFMQRGEHDTGRYCEEMPGLPALEPTEIRNEDKYPGDIEDIEEDAVHTANEVHPMGCPGCPGCQGGCTFPNDHKDLDNEVTSGDLHDAPAGNLHDAVEDDLSQPGPDWVQPQGSFEGNLRLAGPGSSDLKGRLEMFHAGKWGTVCDDSLGDQGAQVACRALGLNGGMLVNSGEFGESHDPIWLADVDCTGEEATLANCHTGGWGVHDCEHYEDAAIRCSPRLDNCDETLSGPKDSMYRGCQTKTQAGDTCKQWSERDLRQRGYTNENYPDGGLGEHNFCRNPLKNGKGNNGIWCWTTNPSVRWDFCDPVGAEPTVVEPRPVATVVEEDKDKDKDGGGMSAEMIAKLMALAGEADIHKDKEMPMDPPPQGAFTLEVEVADFRMSHVQGAIVEARLEDDSLVGRSGSTSRDGMGKLTAPEKGYLKITCKTCVDYYKDFNVAIHCQDGKAGCQIRAAVNLKSS